MIGSVLLATVPFVGDGVSCWVERSAGVGVRHGDEGLLEGVAWAVKAGCERDG